MTEAGSSRRWKYVRMGLWAAPVLVALVAVADHFGAFESVRGYAGNDLRFDQRKYTLVCMADRRSVVLLSATRNIKVRLLGISESSPDAAAYLAKRCNGREVLLKMDEGRTRDEQGRLIGYLYLDEDCLNQELLAKGLAACDRAPHQLQKVFEQAEAGARKKEVGIWGESSKR